MRITGSYNTLSNLRKRDISIVRKQIYHFCLASVSTGIISVNSNKNISESVSGNIHQVIRISYVNMNATYLVAIYKDVTLSKKERNHEINIAKTGDKLMVSRVALWR